MSVPLVLSGQLKAFWATLRTHVRAVALDPTQMTPSPPLLTPGLITSFHPAGIFPPGVGCMSDRFAPWNSAYGTGSDAAYGYATPATEIYLFMQRELKSVCRLLEFRDKPTSAVHLLQMIGEESTGKSADKLADRIVTIFGLTMAKPRISGVATFIPEISNFDEPTARRGQLAVAGALRIASALSRRTGSPQVAELVAGRRICNIRRLPESEVDAALQNQNRNFSGTTSIDSRARIVLDESELKPTGRQVRVLSWPDSEILQTHLLDSLVRAIDLSGVDLLRDHVSIALELEPGPLYLLRDWTTLESLCMRMNHHAHPAIRQATGFNLDIAHWRLADISIEQVRADAKVRKDSMLPDTSIHTSILQRVVHAHAAGHHPAGHFADGPLLRAGKLAGENHFRPWIALLKERCRLQSPLPFSGQVSLEFEAAPSISAVMESLHDLGRLLQSI